MSEGLPTLPPLNSTPFKQGDKVIVHPVYKFVNDAQISADVIKGLKDDDAKKSYKENKEAHYKKIEEVGLYNTPGTIDASEYFKDDTIPDDHPDVSELVMTTKDTSGSIYIPRRFLILQPSGGKRKSRRNKKTKPGKPNKKRRKKTNRRGRR